jgi:hypothetical protein
LSTKWLPVLFGPKRQILLLSHMRAYTSLFGHILGSHPEVCGYYEMHIGYYSWKSLVRQRMLYFEEEDDKPGSRFMFDKVLHDEHETLPAVLSRQSLNTLFSLRPPQETIPSIIRLYQSVDASHEFAGEAGAFAYYRQRVSSLARMAEAMHSDYYYFDAGCLKKQPQDVLESLSEWLGLQSPLSAQYQLHSKTAREKFGDSSGNIKSGKIVEAASNYNAGELDQQLLIEASTLYQTVRNRLASSAAVAVLDGSPEHSQPL